MREEKEVQIGEKTFRIRQMSATQGLKFIFTIAKLTGQSIKNVKKPDLQEIDLGLIANALMNNFDEDKYCNLLKDIFKDAILIPMNFNFDNDFAGSYDDMFDLITEILKLNYAESFDKLKKKLAILKAD